jgi:hypothetical protein
MKKTPVYSVFVPEYRFEASNGSGEDAKYDLTPWHSVQIPKVFLENAPDFGNIGSQIDVCFKREFMGRHVAVRAIGSQEHQGRSLDELVEICDQLGHDRYDKERKGEKRR